MKAVYADCFSGVSGDMFLGALVDLGLPIEELRAALLGLPVRGFRLEAERVSRQGLSGHAVRVALDPAEAQPERHLSEVEAIIRESSLSDDVKDTACRVFRVLADAEAAVHGVPVAAVHFHEVGAVDAIVDVVGVVWGLKRLGVQRVFASSLPAGSGSVQSAHGALPVPAPATLALLAGRHAPIRPSPATTELVTPTGAALLVTLAVFQQPELRLERIGYGFGQRTLPWPNVLRLWLGDTPAEATDTDRIAIVEANLDDDLPETLGAAMTTLLDAGALDVFFTPIQMKKNRPAVKLTVLAPIEHADEFGRIVIRETSTLGVRISEARRIKAHRWQDRVATPWGEVLVKVKEFEGQRTAAPEYDDCRRVAHAAGVSLAEVYRVARAAALGGLDDEDS